MRKARKVDEALGVKVATEGASAEVLHALGIPIEWAQRSEDAAHIGHDGTSGALATRPDWLRTKQFSNFLEKISQPVPMAAAIILASVKWCGSRNMIKPAA